MHIINKALRNYKYIALSYLFLFHDPTALVSLSLLIVELSRLHPDTPHSVGLPWTRDRPVAKISGWNQMWFLWNNATECSFSWGFSTCSGNKEILSLLLITKVHYLIHKSSYPSPVYSYPIEFNVKLHSFHFKYIELSLFYLRPLLPGFPSDLRIKIYNTFLLSYISYFINRSWPSYTN